MFMESEYNTAKLRLKIDMMDLETEFIEHPSRMQAVIECTTDMMQIRDTAAASLKQIIAIAAEQLRVPDKDGKLPSEAKLNSLSVLDKNVVLATEELAEAEHDLRYWQGLSESYRAKGSSLKHISELTVAGWLAPSQNRRQELQTFRDASDFQRTLVSKKKPNV
jgi:hypothetical protein